MKTDVQKLTKMALVAGLYVVLSVFLGNLSYGPIQFRISEVLAFMVLIDKRYIYAVTLGCAIANLFSTLGPIDLVVGTLSTFCSLQIIYWLTKKMNNIISKLLITVLILVIFMLPITCELYFILKVPFWLTLVQTMLGELVVSVIGAIIFYIILSQRKE